MMGCDVCTVSGFTVPTVHPEITVCCKTTHLYTLSQCLFHNSATLLLNSDTSWNHWVVSSARCTSVCLASWISPHFLFVCVRDYHCCTTAWPTETTETPVKWSSSFSSIWGKYLHIWLCDKAQLFATMCVHYTMQYPTVWGHYLKGFVSSLLIVVYSFTHSFRVAVVHLWVHASLHAYVGTCLLWACSGHV